MIGSLKERDGFLVPLVLTANPLACSRNVLMDEKRRLRRWFSQRHPRWMLLPPFSWTQASNVGPLEAAMACPGVEPF